MAGFSDDKTRMFPCGCIDELFSIPTGEVILMDYNNNNNSSKGQNLRVLSTGYFAVNLIFQATSRIISCVCSVGGFQWPITKDIVIVRMAKRTFAFALPGLLYGLQFPKLVPEIVIENLVAVFMKFGHYKDLNDNRQGYPLEDNTPNIWNILRPRIEPTAHETLTRLGQPAGKSRFCVADKNSPFLRAIRMSATTKLVIDGMVRTGVLTRDRIIISGSLNPPEEQLGVIYASIDAFASPVDALELSWLVFGGSGDLVKGAHSTHRGGNKDIGYSVWSVNEDGVAALLRLLVPAAEEEECVMKEKEAQWKAKDREKEEAGKASASANNNGNNVMP